MTCDEIYDEHGQLTEEWYARQRARGRAFQGANGLWYAATEDGDGSHRQGVGRYETAQAALSSWRERYTKEATEPTQVSWDRRSRGN